MSNQQTSGSLTIDMSGVVRAMREELEPVLRHIGEVAQSLSRRMAAIELDSDGMASTLHEALAHGNDGATLADYLIGRGYRLTYHPVVSESGTWAQHSTSSLPAPDTSWIETGKADR